MNLPQVFKTPDNGTIRATSIDGNPWFVAKDVCEAVGINTSNVGNKVGAVPDEWKGRYPIATVDRGIQNLLCLAEPGLYFFLARSDKPAALPFQKWIAGEVIPSIRKNGSYSIAKKSERPISATLVAELRKVYGAEAARARIDHLIGFTKPAFSGHAGNYSPEFTTVYRKCRDYIQAVDRGASLEEVEKTIHGETGACSDFIELAVRFAHIHEGTAPALVYEPTPEAQA